jgi:hypothetical protein
VNSDQRKVLQAEWNAARLEHVKACPACKTTMRNPPDCYWDLYRAIYWRHEEAARAPR